jgi:FkbM family methyltransferase
MRWIVGSQRHACWLGIYESHFQKLLSARIQPGGTFYDVGANAGFYTLLASRRVGDGMVISFEPLPENVAYLRRHVQLNRLKNVRLVEAAVSDSDGAGSFQSGNTRSEGRLDPQGGMRVRTVTLDAVVSCEALPPPNYIKMDIEGSEYKALIGAKACFERFRPELFLATHGKAIHEDCSRLLTSWGYDLRVMANPEKDRSEVHALAR